MHQDDRARGEGWLESVRRVLDVVRGTDVSELEVSNEAQEFLVRVRRGPGAPQPVPPPATRTDAPVPPADDARLHRIVAPLTGVFYRSPSPTARPYVAVGDWVDAEAVVGLIETMKIFNEVTADQPGRVARFVAEPGQLVHTGDLLLLLEPGERSPARPEAPE